MVATSAHADAHGQTGCPVLVVEDDVELREMMVQLLTLEGFDAEPAVDGQDALDKLHTASVRPHVIILDMMMPRMDGWEFCRRRAQDASVKQIPVVILSAAPAAMLDIGAEAVLTKPFDLERLLTTVRAYC